MRVGKEDVNPSQRGCVGARSQYGAEGGSGHHFFEADYLPIVRKLCISEASPERKKSRRAIYISISLPIRFENLIVLCVFEFEDQECNWTIFNSAASERSGFLDHTV
jgi:hypothetical protein